MKPMVTCTLAGLTLALALTGCGMESSKPASTPKPTASPQASLEPESSMMPDVPMTPDPEATTLPQSTLAPLSQTLNSILEYGQDTAGGSLKNVTSAASLLDWWEESQKADPLADPTDQLKEWYDGLSQEERDIFWENWEYIRSHGQALTQDPSSLQGLMESAGVSKDYTGLAGSYNTLFDAVDRLKETK